MDNNYIDPVRLSPKQLVNSAKLTRSLAFYIEQAKKRPIFITKNNEVEAVFIGLDEYRKLLAEKLEVEDLIQTANTIIT